MKTCEFCKSVSSDDSKFCGQCGRRMSTPEETYTGDSITLTSLPVLNDIGLVVEEYTTSNSTIKKETGSRHDTPIIGEDKDWDHKILQNAEEEEDEEESKFAPFLPMPGSGFVQPAGSVPVVQGPLNIDSVPSVNTPQIPGPSAPGIVHPGGSLAPQIRQPAQPPPAPQVEFAPQHATIPTQPLRHPRAGHYRHFLRQRHLPRTSLVVVVVASILASTVIAIITLFPKTNSLTSPIAELIGAPILGKAVLLHGGNFVPGETVMYTIDVKLGTSAQGNALVGSSNSMNASALLFASQSEQPSSLQHKTIDSDGTFNATIFIDPNWGAGSNHTVYVYNRDGKLIKSLPFIVVVPVAQTGLVGCVNGADPIILGPISEGSNQRVSKTITLCTTGSGPIDWTARWDQTWLQLNHSGQIMAPQNGQVTISALANGLKPGSYTTSVIFSSRQSNVKVSLSVTFVVLKKAPSSAQTAQSAIECVSATPQSLSFVNTAMQSNTLLQRVTISNCGDSGTWSGSVSADNGKQWLGIDASGGTLHSGDLHDVIIAVSSANLQPGTYTGHVNFSIGSSNVRVQVTFTVRPPQTAPPCIHVNTQSLVFMGFAGQSDPSPQQVGLINCGATGHWATSMTTDDSANWLNTNLSGGNLKEGGTQQIRVVVSSVPLLANKGTYTGKITFAMGSSIITLNVTFIVIPQCIRAGPQSFDFESTAGQANPSPQSVTIANCGAPGRWLGSVSTDNGADWLSISQSSGHLNLGATQSITVKVSSAQLSSGTYTGQILFAMGASTSSIQVKFTVKQSQECISVNTDLLSFTSMQDRGDPDSGTVTVGNCGYSMGRWSSSIYTDNGTLWIRIDPSGGELKSGASQDVSIRLSTAGLSLGDHQGYITFSMGSSSKTVKITLTIKPQGTKACIRRDRPSLTFTSRVADNSSTTVTNSGSETEEIRNCGDPGDWSVQVLEATDDSNWLRFKPAGGHLQTGESTDVSITVDSSGLGAGTYSATIQFKITVGAETTDTKNVRVTLTVSPSRSLECEVHPSSLTFTSVWGKDPPAAQEVTLTNCGANDIWTASDDSNTSLDVLPRRGNLDSRGSQVVSVRTDDLTTIPPMSYKYTVTLTTGDGNMVVVPVTWNLLPPPNSACIQSDPSSLSFSVTQGESTETSADFINCGAYTGTVSIDPPTSDDANWLTVKSLDGSGSYAAGYGPGILIGLDSRSLASGKTYKGNIRATITTPQGSRASVTVGVTFEVQASSSMPKAVVPVQSDTSTVVPTPTVTVTLVCESSCVVQTSTVIPTDTSTSGVTPTGTSTPSPTDTPTPTPGVTPTDTPTPGVTPTDTSTPTPTDTPTPTPGVTPTPTDTPTPMPGVTPTPTDTPTPTPTPGVTPTDTPTPTPTPMPTPTPADTPTPTPTPGVTPTAAVIAIIRFAVGLMIKL